MPAPVICFDFDGTLVDSQVCIHPRDIEILATERRAIFIPATARLLPSVRRAFARNGLFVDQPIPFPLVLQNGSALYGAGEVLQAQYPFAPDVQAALLDLMFAHPQVTFCLYTLTEVHALWLTPVTLKMAQRFGLDPQPFTPASRDQQFTKLACIAETPESLHAFSAAIAGWPLEQCFSLPLALEVNQVGIDKGRGLATLLRILGLDDSQVAVAGDGGNDLPLFDVATLSFAPDSSTPAVLNRAQHVLNVRKTGLLAPILRTIGLQ